MEALLKLKSVLCDPDGLVCVAGSEADRGVVQSSLAEIEANSEKQAAELAAAWAEIERLNASPSIKGASLRQMEILEKQLAAEQAKNVELWEWLPKVAVLGGYEEEQKYLAALSSPPDTSALEALIVKAGEKMREKCADVCESRTVLDADNGGGAASCETEIRALPGVTLEDLK